MIALNAIHSQRETFWDEDTIRIHPIITKGGDAVSVVPAEVTMETFVRGGSLEAIVDANHEGRSLPARPGRWRWAPRSRSTRSPATCRSATTARWGKCSAPTSNRCSGPEEFDIGGHRTGSTRYGPTSPILMPVIHPYVASAQGKTHGADFRINEPEHAYLTPAKLLAMTAIDLLYDDAAPAETSSPTSNPPSPRIPTSPSNDGLFKKEHYKAAEWIGATLYSLSALAE